MAESTHTPFPIDRWPQAILGVGALLALVLLGELVVIEAGLAPLHDGFVPGVVSSLPFLSAILYGARWLARSDLPVERYERIGGWFAISLTGFAIVVLGIVLAMRSMDALFVVSTVRWGACIGGCFGLVVGIFDARGVERELAAERLRVREAATRRERDRLEEFASIVSHDLRNPLNVAAARLELAREEADSPHLDDVSAALERIDGIIDDTLTLAREGQTVGETDAVELAAVAERSWRAVETGDAALVVEDSTVVAADADRLRHVFENLFRNASEHATPDAPPIGSEEAPPDATPIENVGATVTVHVGPLPDGRGFFVEDDGPGIPADQRADVFDPGYSTAREGSGFGLAIVERVVEAHGWEITVAEGRDGGARFEITGVETE